MSWTRFPAKRRWRSKHRHWDVSDRACSSQSWRCEGSRAWQGRHQAGRWTPRRPGPCTSGEGGPKEITRKYQPHIFLGVQGCLPYQGIIDAQPEVEEVGGEEAEEVVLEGPVLDVLDRDLPAVLDPESVLHEEEPVLVHHHVQEVEQVTKVVEE